MLFFSPINLLKVVTCTYSTIKLLWTRCTPLFEYPITPKHGVIDHTHGVHIYVSLWCTWFVMSKVPHMLYHSTTCKSLELFAQKHRIKLLTGKIRENKVNHQKNPHPGRVARAFARPVKHFQLWAELYWSGARALLQRMHMWPEFSEFHQLSDTVWCKACHMEGGC